MKLQKLPLLHHSMQQQGLTKTRFEFQFRTLTFSVIYIADRSFPHTLLFGCRGHNLFIVVEVNGGYAISSYLGDNFKKLVTALDLRYDPDNQFKPGVFFEAFDAATPTSTSSANVPTMSEIASHSRDIEEADKIYFIGWRTHDGIRSNASVENLAKTLRVCGPEAYDICLANNISSCWTDDPERETAFYLP